jgi:hypothetical protein
MMRPTPERRAEMAAFIDAKQPGLLDYLGIPRVVDVDDPCGECSRESHCLKCQCCDSWFT